MRKNILVAALALILGSASVHAWALRFAYVDVSEVFDQFEGTQSAKKELKAEATNKRKELETQQDELRKKIDDLQSKKSVMSTSKYEAEEGKLKEQAQALQAQIQEVQDDLANTEKKKTKAILDQIRGLIKDMAEQEKYDFVFEKSSLLYGGDDITYKVIKAMNAK